MPYLYCVRKITLLTFFSPSDLDKMIYISLSLRAPPPSGDGPFLLSTLGPRPTLSVIFPSPSGFHLRRREPLIIRLWLPVCRDKARRRSKSRVLRNDEGEEDDEGGGREKALWIWRNEMLMTLD